VLWYYWKLQGEQFVILRLLIESVMPLGILTIVVLAVSCSASPPPPNRRPSARRARFLLALQARTLDWERVKQSAFLTAKTTAMVCWLFVGSALFSAVFAILGGQQLVEHGAVAQPVADPVHAAFAGDHLHTGLAARMDRDHRHFRADLSCRCSSTSNRPDPLGNTGLRQPSGRVPVAAGGDVGVLSEGRVAAHVTLNQIFAGMMPYMIIVIVCMSSCTLAGDDAVAAKLPVRRR
jgi:hypothetical protein